MNLEKDIQEPEEEIEVIKEVVGEEEVEQKDEPCEDCPKKEDEVKEAEQVEQSEVKEEEVKEEEVKEEEGGKLDSDLKQSLEDVDPWMANKLKEEDA